MTGPGAVIGDALARHPGVDKIAFTGSTEVGRSLLRAVGETDVKAISLELGGKSPQVVLADVGDLATAAVGDRLGDLLQQRPDLQRRLAARRPSLGPRGARRADRGARAGAGARRAARPGDPARLDRRRAPARQGPRLRRARAATRAPAWSPAASGSARRAAAPTSPPTILDGVANSMRVAREEIFGPVLTVTEFEDEDEALAHRQRHAVRPGGRPLDARRQPGPPSRAPDPGRGRVGQHVRHGRHHGPVRRLQAVGLRARQGAPRPRRLHPAQDDLVRPVGRVAPVDAVDGVTRRRVRGVHSPFRRIRHSRQGIWGGRHD